METKSSADWDGHDMIGQPEPTLTDEELVGIGGASWVEGAIVDRLIAALRASRARVKELEDGIEAFLSGRNPL